MDYTSGMKPAPPPPQILLEILPGKDKKTKDWDNNSDVTDTRLFPFWQAGKL